MLKLKNVPFWNTFASDQKGAAAIIFAVAVIPLLLFVGAAVDFSKITSERARLQASLDSAALAISGQGGNATVAKLKQRAQKYFDANYRNGQFGSNVTLTLVKINDRFKLTGNLDVDLTFMKLAGQNYTNISAASEVTAERKKIELALVLDNTGSMGSAGKMPALKTAVNDLINKLQAKVQNPGDVKMSIVPFNTEVKINTNYFNASWLRWDVVLENTSLNWAARQPPTQGQWTGCLADRDQPYDISSAPAGIFTSRYVAAKCHAASQAQMEPLTTNLELIRTRAQSMSPNGYTNVTMGLTMGLATLRNDSPFGQASSNGSNVEKFLILLTDGNNTRNRWSSSQNPIDARLTAACNQAKAGNVKIFTIRVINGNASLLQSCASNPSMYYNVQNANQLQPVFQQILDSIQGVRITS